ncbi:hypothetical protein PVAND_001644 [Polypedilum vanderplanki]|uniref:pyrroline-5-carboxylate reductase n=1 Tax=Polypedilum vanderplanki TaxID=319348 RepID=A0A9J6BP07_POLVA|nr:hypothetical protein PVAND_001644 [Polypedilum vanderplanki]
MEDIIKYKNSFSTEAKLGFIGCGNMAFSIVKGLLQSKLFEANEIIVSGTRDESFERLKSLGKINTTKNNNEVVRAAAIIFLCVKPAHLDAVAISLKKNFLNPDEIDLSNLNKTLVSILAGTSLNTLREAIPNFGSYIRVMPNTPLQVGAGCSAITIFNASLDLLNSYNAVKAIFCSLGLVDVLDESKFHAITALSGSGPAYVYIIIDALSDAGVKQGLPRDIATRFAAQTLLGASKTVLESSFHVGQLKDQVTSSGGTTIHAIHELEKGGIRNTLFNAIEAATKRSKEMSEN